VVSVAVSSGSAGGAAGQGRRVFAANEGSSAPSPTRKPPAPALMGSCGRPGASASFPQVGQGNKAFNFVKSPDPAGRTCWKTLSLAGRQTREPRSSRPSSAKPPICSMTKPKKEKATSASLPIFLGSKYTSCL